MKQRLTAEEAFGAYDIELNPIFADYPQMLTNSVEAHSLVSDLVSMLSKDDQPELLGMARSAELILDNLAVQLQITYHSDEKTTITD